jgi:hypothetical protein
MTVTQAFTTCVRTASLARSRSVMAVNPNVELRRERSWREMLM